MHRIVERNTKHFNYPRRMPTGVLFFGVAKAFNNVPQRLILQAVQCRRARSSRAHHSRLFVMSLSAIGSRVHCPPLTILSSLLYSLFTRDIPKYQWVNLALFDDETALYYSAHGPNLVSTALLSVK